MRMHVTNFMGFCLKQGPKCLKIKGMSIQSVCLHGQCKHMPLPHDILAILLLCVGKMIVVLISMQPEAL